MALNKEKFLKITIISGFTLLLVYFVGVYNNCFIREKNSKSFCSDILSKLSILNSVSAFRYAWRPDTKDFPYDQFPAPAIIDNGDNDGKILQEVVVQLNVTTDTTSCIPGWVGNGKCDAQNNQAKCNWDGGDCCLNTCQVNCDNLFATNGTNCTYSCGTAGYNCLDPSAGCQKCNTDNGVCRVQNACLNGTKSNFYEYIYQYLDDCYAYSWSMGNSRTINSYCGTDPNFTVIHDPSNPTLHFPGCGLTEDQCTLLPCCDDAIRYGLTSLNCNNSIKTYSFFSQATYSNQETITSCQAYFYTCFTKVMAYKGQCCQCNYGWTGMDCTTPVCAPPCVNGVCVGPNTCQCQKGWQGITCSDGVCSKCQYGLCIAPEVCECFYGYEGAGCDVPKSLPSCLHGTPIKPDTCSCNVGWTGPACDVPNCPLGCNNGYCVDAQVCECYPGYYSSTQTSLCDKIDCKFLDPHCFDCNLKICTECDLNYYLNPSNNSCISCKNQYDPMCLDCNTQQCLECYWPFRLDPFTLTCQSSGLLEFAEQNLTVIETQGTYTVTVRRLYSSVNTISVDYELSLSYPYHTRMEYLRGTLTFPDGTLEQDITGMVFRRQYFEQDDSFTTFTLTLSNPSQNTEIGFNNKVIIYYYDDLDALNDAYYCQVTLNGLYNVERNIQMLIGVTNSLNISSFFTPTTPKTDGLDLFIVELQNADASTVQVIKSTYNTSNIYFVNFIAKSLDLKAVRIYASTLGFGMNYYDNTRFLSLPYIQRIENRLPNIFTYETQSLSYFSLRVETFLIYLTNLASPEQITYTVTLSDQSSAKFYVGSLLVYDTGAFNCFDQYYAVGETCCLATKSFTVQTAFDMTGNQPYYFRIDFRHKEGYPCMRVYRQSTSLALGDLSLEANAPTELRESPFIIEPLINKDIINFATTDMEILKFIDTNTNQMIDDNTLQAAIQNMLVIYPRDIYGNIIEGLTNLLFEATLNDGVNTVTNTSYYNGITKRYELILTPIKTTNDAILTIQADNQNIFGSPFNVTIIPGPYSLPNSDENEYNGADSDRCYINQLCSIQITLRDAERNIVDVPNLFTLADMDALIVGPFGNSDSASTQHETLYITLFNNSLSYPGGIYFIQYVRYYVGYYLVYIRLADQEAPIFPYNITVLTNSVDPPHTIILTTGYQQQIAGVPFTLQIQAKDQYGNIVTTSDVKIKTWLMNENVTLPDINNQVVSYMGDGIYNITANLTVMGWYAYHIQVMDLLGVYGDIYQTPTQLYLNATYPSANYSSASGSGVSKAIIGRKEQVYLQVLDVFGNRYSSDKYNGTLVYQTYVLVDNNKTVPVNLSTSTNSTGYFQFVYQLLGNYQTVLEFMEVWTSSDGGNTFSYQNISGSPFSVSLGVLDLELYESYDDLSLGGFGVTSLSFIQSITPYQSQQNIIVGQNFQITVEPRNAYNQNFAYFEDSNNYFLVVFTPLVDYAYGNVSKGYQCNCRSDTQKYCKYFSHSQSDCLKLLGCQWLHNTPAFSNTTYIANYGSCAPCSNGCDDNSTWATGGPLDRQEFAISEQEFFTKKAFLYQVIPTSDNTNYFFTQNLILSSSSYLISIVAFRIGEMRMVIYSNPDYTGYVDNLAVPTLNLTFDQNLHPFFANRAKFFSVTLQGKIRYDHDNLVNFTVFSNKACKIYIDDQLVLDKPSYVKQHVAGFLIREMHIYQLIDFEVFISDDDLLPEFNYQSGFFTLYQESGNALYAQYKPKNFFMFEHIQGSGNTTIAVKADVAQIANSTAYEVNNLVQLLQYEKIFRAGQIFNFEVRVKDYYKNLRGVGYADTVSAKIQLNRTLITVINSLMQNQNNGFYTYQFIPTAAPAHYTIQFFIDNQQMIQFFEFNLINTFLDAQNTLITYLGYMGYKQNDCVFVNRPLYVVFDMRDMYNNFMPYNDITAFQQLDPDPSQPQFINPTLQPGGLTFYPSQCYQYLNFPYTVMCPMRPLTVGNSQTLDVKDYKGVSFQGFPISSGVHVREFKQEAFKSDGSNALQKTVNVLSASQTQVTLSFTSRDIYGNMIVDETLCSYYYHNRYLLYFNFAYYKLNTTTTLTSLLSYQQIYQIYKPSVSESFDSVNSIKTFSISSNTPDQTQVTPATQYDEMFLNYTLLDGLNFQDGLLAKFYTNNNFLGDKPLYRSILSQSYIDGSDQTTNWYRMHREFKDFSVKITSLIKPPYSEVYTFVTGFTQNFQVYVDDQLVIDFNKTTGSIPLYQNKYSKLKMLYYFSNNSGVPAGSVPQLTLNWQSSSLSFGFIQQNQSIAIDLDDNLETVLIKDNFRVQ